VAGNAPGTTGTGAVQKLNRHRRHLSYFKTNLAIISTGLVEPPVVIENHRFG